MKPAKPSHSRARLAIVRWTARVGAVTAESVARYEGTSVASARGRLCAAQRVRLLTACRPLTARPALFTVTREGLRAAGLSGFEPVRVSPANARHAIACADAAAALACAFPDHVVSGEHELRRDERAYGGPLASARVSDGAWGPQLHRPDLVLWPRGARGLPAAVEVELTVKSPRRLLELCRAWARCRCVSGVLYLVAVDAQAPVARAVAQAQASAQITLVSLDALLEARSAVRAGSDGRAIESPVAADA